MLTKTQIRAAAVERIDALRGSCNEGHITHNDGVLRGLIWAMTGKDPGTYITEDMARVFTLLGIPYVKKPGGMLEYTRRIVSENAKAPSRSIDG